MVCSTIPSLPIALPGDIPSCCGCCDPSNYVGKTLSITFISGDSPGAGSYSIQTATLPWDAMAGAFVGTYSYDSYDNGSGPNTCPVIQGTFLGSGSGLPLTVNIVCSLELGVPVYDIIWNGSNITAAFRPQVIACATAGPACCPGCVIYETCTASYASSCFGVSGSYDECWYDCESIGVPRGGLLTIVTAIVS